MDYLQARAANIRTNNCIFVCMQISRAAVLHLNFRAGTTFPVPVCTVPCSMDRTSRCNKVDAVRLYASYRLNLLLLKRQRCLQWGFKDMITFLKILMMPKFKDLEQILLYSNVYNYLWGIVKVDSYGEMPLVQKAQRNWVFDTNSKLLIPISLQPNVVVNNI